MAGRVCHQNSLSDPFAITGGLKQGCVLAPTCFSLYTAAMLNEIPPDTPSIDLRYRLDGGVFSLVRLRARSKTTMCSVRELQYADDNATPGQTADDLQSLADAYNTAYERFGMQINTEKTKLLVQPPPRLSLPNTNTTVNGQPLEQLDQLSYLGSILTSTPTCRKDVEIESGQPHSAFGRLNCRIFKTHALTMASKILVFRAKLPGTERRGGDQYAMTYARKKGGRMKRQCDEGEENAVDNTRPPLPSHVSTIRDYSTLQVMSNINNNREDRTQTRLGAEDDDDD
ncbi:unnamed protein product [Acanthosepion pharaonis]|uniref:Reverse transcriptase domain-containing protein n=1 Tax=Acanthosepion pharaonis TaxID=158019 RepID=A0A812EHK6_ACAPH|nr:unnamed protein product [Sepia pharaonis]